MKSTARLGSRAVTAGDAFTAWFHLLRWLYRLRRNYIFRATDGQYRYCRKGFMPQDVEELL